MVYRYTHPYLRPSGECAGTVSGASRFFAPWLQVAGRFLGSALGGHRDTGAGSELLCYGGILANVPDCPSHLNGARHVRIGLMAVSMMSTGAGTPAPGPAV